MKKKKFKHRCPECGQEFNSWQAKNRHIAEGHELPKKTTEVALRREFDRTLKKGSKLDLGDVIFLSEKCVIVKITHTENDPDVKVVLMTIKSSYDMEE